MAYDVLFSLSFQKLGFGAMFCKQEREEIREGVEKWDEIRVSVKMRYNIFKIRNISFSYVQVSVFRQYSLLVLCRQTFWILCPYLTCWLVFLIVFLNNHMNLWQSYRTFQVWITFTIEKACQATKCVYEYIF